MAVGVRVGVTVGVAVGVGMGVAVGVPVGVAVGVADGVTVGVGLTVGVAVTVCVAVGLGIRVLKQNASSDGFEPRLLVSSRLVNDTVEVRVWDNGTGIADDVIGHIFNPFFSTRDGALGAGLGLPISADVARRAGGDLSVDTVHGEYAEFKLSLPATASAVAVGAGRG